MRERVPFRTFWLWRGGFISVFEACPSRRVALRLLARADVCPSGWVTFIGMRVHFRVFQRRSVAVFRVILGGVGSGERFLKAGLRQSGRAFGPAVYGTRERVPFQIFWLWRGGIISIFEGVP
jgi:hypothetical protein